MVADSLALLPEVANQNVAVAQSGKVPADLERLIMPANVPVKTATKPPHIEQLSHM